MPDARLPRLARLARPRDYRRVFAQPSKSTDGCFMILARRRPTDVPARLGLAISKRLARRAVDRNRLKRIVRESFRKHRTNLYGLDIVVLSRRDANTSSNQQLICSLSSHWRRILDQLCARF